MSNQVYETILSRSSIRGFERDVQLTDEQTEKLRQAALASPSARNLQPWHFVFVQNRDLIDEINDIIAEKTLETADEKTCKIIEARNRKIFYDAPTVVFIFGDKANPWSELDCGIAVQNIALAAQAEGLSSCIIGFAKIAFSQGDLQQRLGVGDSYKFCISIAVGNGTVEKAPHDFIDDKVSFIK